jgi:hypothetical protein
MNTNIDITNINSHFLPTFAEKREECATHKYNTNLAKYCFYSKNEADISDKIKQIQYYSNNFAHSYAKYYVNYYTNGICNYY